MTAVHVEPAEVGSEPGYARWPALSTDAAFVVADGSVWRLDSQSAAYEAPPEPVVPASKAREFQRGDTVTFDDRDSRSINGVIVRINQRTATIGTGDGGTWRVSFHMLRHVLEI